MNDRLPTVTRSYQNGMIESKRWDGVVARDGDIVITTSYKAGTTWTQMICALLVHQTTDMPMSMAEMSPWLDMNTDSIEVIITPDFLRSKIA